MNRLSQKPLFSADTIKEMVELLAEKIKRNYTFDCIVSLLTGSYIFVADLSRHFFNPEINIFFIKGESYGNSSESCGRVKISLLESLDIKDKKILLVDDILDSGHTLLEVSKQLKTLGAKEIRSCVLLDKPDRREVDYQADFIGFTIDDKFIVGYGLDYAGRYRTLPDIWTLNIE